jgi:hypothetical protein
MKKLIYSAVSVVAVSLLAASVLAKDGPKLDPSKLPPAGSKTGVTFDSDVKPVFEKSCFKCHGSEKQKGKLRVDSLDAVLKGGEDGKVVVPGKSAESLLVYTVARVCVDEDDFMPPEDKGKPLTKEQVGLIRAWIDQGAK